MGGRALETVLIVEDDVRLSTAITRVLSGTYRTVGAVGSIAEARKALDPDDPPDLLLLDVELPDGSALDLLSEVVVDLAVAPLVLVMSGAATPSESFELARYGVRHYLSKPIDLQTLDDAIQLAANSAPDLRPHLRAAVGQRGIHEVEEEVRRTMLCEAVSRARGSRRAAARMLGVSRQLVQHMLRKQFG